ncbi:acetamidase/formamidase family protein [Paenibacillus abyssi]|uniref:Acetamidase n=1 Tax=Paenibacillus abyssi TaxID=1340531 RepID=A0A917CZQ7_9BACL|nr:acetamidase/formamidase family protein [Paenibacillus abyssi]GGG03943.1 acetamidase [Paenibacillus abyssi]
MTKHTILPQSGTLHGSFSRDNEPILTIQSGDSVSYSTLDGDWLKELKPAPNPGHGPEFELRDPIRDAGHAMCGPIAIEGAMPGMTLAVRINENRPASWGWSRVGGRQTEHDLRLGVSEGEPYYLSWELNNERMLATSHLGHSVRMQPFMGVLGMPPDEPGLHSTHPPRFCGGNMDCKELVPGTTLYLPIAVKGGLFSVGDGHAAQGDGEVGSTAIECPMDKVDLTFTLLPDMKLAMPRANTPAGWLTFGFHEDLKEATYTALNGMVDLLQEVFGFHRKEALALCSYTVDLRITQIVNGVCGVHAVLPHGSIRC